MEQSEQIATKTREFAQVQIGSQVLSLCEAHAVISVLQEQLAAVTKERDDLQKAGKRKAGERAD